MEKRALLAVILSLAVLFLFQAYFAPPEQPDQTLVDEETLESFPAETTPDIPAEKVSPPSFEPAPTGPEKEIRVETALYTAVFSNRGATLKSWVLKNYLDQLGSEGEPVEMVTSQQGRPRPLTSTLLWTQRSETLDIDFRPDRETLDLTGSEKEGQIVFTGTTGEGVPVKKTITFSSENYWIDIAIEVTPPPSLPSPKGTLINWIRILDPEKDTSGRFGFTGPAVYGNGKLHEIKLKSLDEGKASFSRRIRWVAYEDKYFLAAFFSRNDAPTSVDIAKRDENAVEINFFEKTKASAGSGTYGYAYGFYCGPKDIEILRSLGVELEKAIDFGMFDIIAKPLLYTLKYLNKVTRNYGWAIIILTIIIKIIFFPLTHKSYKSMKAMKDLQPKMMALRKKYKDDKDQLNRETMNLYRTHKVNPLGGCLPLLIQFPIFIAFYWVLLGSIELRHAPFMLWINDLSAQDPYYITPVLMGASMFIQQKMTPMAGDPTQAKVMLAMPIIFTFLFLKFPSGLVLYWLVNNVLQIFQQLYIDKRVS
jgi:YidC/Oxa1 family membrane protein insertase